MNLVDYRPNRWWHWILIIILSSVGISLSAFVLLVKLPQSASCESGISPHDAGGIIYCATTTVDEQSPGKLVAAISLAHSIPQDNPLRENSDRLINKWVNSLLLVSEKSFHEGNFQDAVDALEELPQDIPNYATIREKMLTWEAVWKQGEDIYEQAKAIVDPEEQQTWYKALAKAKELRKLDSEYWSNSKYYELIRHIQGLREQAEKTEEEKVAKQKETEKQNDSLANMGLFDSSQIKEDLSQLEKARKLAASNKVDDMRLAISEASLIITDEHYKEAQKLIASLEKKIDLVEDKSYLDNAEKIAKNGDVISLQSAINEASLISKDNGLRQRANQRIKQWQQDLSELNKREAKVSLATVSNPSQSNLSRPNNSANSGKPITSKPKQEVRKNQPTPTPVVSPTRSSPAVNLETDIPNIEVDKLELDLIDTEVNSSSSN